LSHANKLNIKIPLANDETVLKADGLLNVKRSLTVTSFAVSKSLENFVGLANLKSFCPFIRSIFAVGTLMLVLKLIVGAVGENGVIDLENIGAGDDEDIGGS
jgi:hypothetical protein